MLFVEDKYLNDFVKEVEEMCIEGRISNLKFSDGVVIVDYGFCCVQLNEMLYLFVDFYKQKIGYFIVEVVYMELVELFILYVFD